MKYGLTSGILWGLDTVILGIALSMVPLSALRGSRLCSYRELVLARRAVRHLAVHLHGNQGASERHRSGT